MGEYTDTPSKDTVMLWVGAIEHQHGSNQYVAGTEGSMFVQLAEYVRENWAREQEVILPEDLDDVCLVDTYFNQLDHETYWVEAIAVSVSEILQAAGRSLLTSAARDRIGRCLEYTQKCLHQAEVKVPGDAGNVRELLYELEAL